jgi:hypothetical protein
MLSKKSFPDIEENLLNQRMAKIIRQLFVHDKSINQTPNRYVDGLGLIWNKSEWPGNFPHSNYNFTLANGDGFRAGRAEWIGIFLGSQLSLKIKVVPVLVELGSSQGLWCANWIKIIEKLSKNKNKVEAHGYEAAESFKSTRKFWIQNFPEHQITEDDLKLIIENKNWIFIQNRLAVNKNRKDVFFPAVDITKDNGAQIISKGPRKIDQRGKAVSYEKIKSVTISQIANNFDCISVLHVDLQGMETLLLKNRNCNILSEKVVTLVIGTHSTANHNKLKKKLKKNFLIICDEYPLFKEHTLVDDGTITLVNKKYHQELLEELKLI